MEDTDEAFLDYEVLLYRSNDIGLLKKIYKKGKEYYMKEGGKLYKQNLKPEQKKLLINQEDYFNDKKSLIKLDKKLLT